MNLEIIEKVFKESDAVTGCKERYRLLTRNYNTENLVKELWENFVELLKKEIEEDNNKIEENKDKVEEIETPAPTTTENTENIKEEIKEKDAEGKITWHKFLSNKMKEGKKIKEIGELWKKEKEKNETK